MTYYRRNLKFNQYFTRGELQKAEEVLAENESKATNRNVLLWYLNKGVVNSLQGNYQKSNDYFEKAYIYTQDYKEDYKRQAASFLLNPKITQYKGEYFEILLIHFYKAMNFASMYEYQKALVEIRRLNIRLNEMSDLYPKSKEKYNEDAFFQNLMGVLYDASGDINNAFIAYRNAYDTYKGEFSDLFGISAPQQLKKDLLRTAYLLGFNEELRFYEKEFGVDYKHNSSDGGSLILFWLNGLGPVKEEWSINFFTSTNNGVMTFQNEQLGLNIPYNLSGEQAQNDALTDISFLRVAFPKYVSRPTYYSGASISTESGERKDLELGTDIDKVARKSLNDRMLKELYTALIRVALKKATEVAAREENEAVGALLSVANAVSEQADTRNWQTIPHKILYTRFNLEEGTNQVSLNAELKNTSQSNKLNTYTLEGKPGRTHIRFMHSLESQPVPSLDSQYY